MVDCLSRVCCCNWCVVVCLPPSVREKWLAIDWCICLTVVMGSCGFVVMKCGSGLEASD